MNQIELSENVMVSDPCYVKGTWCQQQLKVVPGTYYVNVVLTSKGRIDKLVAISHEFASSTKFENEPHCSIGVDSGQAGIFSLDTFRNDKVFEGKESEFGKRFNSRKDDGGEHWYAHICDLTLNKNMWGTYANGVASSSGWGDGSYGVYVAKNKADQIVGIMIDYDANDY